MWIKHKFSMFICIYFFIKKGGKMKEDVEGKYGKAIIFTDNIEKEAIKQVKTICDMPYSKN